MDEQPESLLRPNFISIIEAAAILGVSVPAVKGLIESGRLRSWRIGARLKVDLTAVRRLDRRTPMRVPKRRPRPSLSTRIRFLVLERDGFRCRYCGATAADERLVVDHVVSVIDGGSSELTNLVTACQPCNAGKGRRSLTIVA